MSGAPWEMKSAGCLVIDLKWRVASVTGRAGAGNLPLLSVQRPIGLPAGAAPA